MNLVARQNCPLKRALGRFKQSGETVRFVLGLLVSPKTNALVRNTLNTYSETFLTVRRKADATSRMALANETKINKSYPRKAPHMSFQPMLEQLRDFDTALVANTIGYIDSTPPHKWYLSGEIQSVTPALGPTVGIAVTCEMDTSSPDVDDDGTVDGYWEQLEQMDAMEEDTVWVVKAVGSRPDHECIIGDGMAKTLYAAGCRGVVTDGRVRDVQGLLTTPFAAYCRGTIAHHCRLRVRSINRPVEIGGVTIRPGDVIHADREGVITIPHACIEALPAKAPQMRAFEHEAHLVLRRTDAPLAEKREQVAQLLARYGFADCVASPPPTP